MKRHTQGTGVRQWAGGDLIDLQTEPLKVLDNYFEEYGSCIIRGCEVTTAGNVCNISPGLVALGGSDQDGAATFKVAPFAGVEGITLPVYLTLAHSVVERAYTDRKVKPIAYDYRAVVVAVQPDAGIPRIEITATGGARFVDVVGLSSKLDKTGNGKDVTATFAQATDRVNVVSGEKLSALWGKVCRFFADLKTVAFTGNAADLTEDATHRLFTDAEREKLGGVADRANNYTHPDTHSTDMITDSATKVVMSKAERDKLAGMASGANNYTHPDTHPAGMITEDKAHRFVTDPEKNSWNNKSDINHNHNTVYAPITHTHPASQVTEQADKRFMTDAERAKIQNSYTKPETYTRSEIDSRDTGVLESAKKYVLDRLSEVINGSPAALDTLYEIANALNNDPNFATTIMALINGKAALVHSHTKGQISDFPASMPASDVYDWAKQANKPGYSPGEVGAAPAGHNHAGVYQPAGNYAHAGHDHAGTYQPAGSYALSMHGHNAGQITEEANKRFMTDAERSKLAQIETGANKYVHPANHPASIITEQVNKRFMTDAERTKLSGNYLQLKTYYGGNANLITEDGKYITDVYTTGLPTSISGGVLIHYRWDDNTMYQTLYAYNDNFYYRRKHGGVWLNWRRIAFV